jgi:hypothetical protein
MQTSELLSKLRPLTRQNLPNNKSHTVGDVSFGIHKFKDINTLIVDEHTAEQKEAILLQANKLAFCFKDDAKMVFINSPLFHSEKLSDDARLAVIVHEYLHLLYPDLGEITIEEYTNRVLTAGGVFLSISDLLAF